jgi:hypothetical protein
MFVLEGFVKPFNKEVVGCGKENLAKNTIWLYLSAGHYQSKLIKCKRYEIWQRRKSG